MWYTVSSIQLIFEDCCVSTMEKNENIFEIWCPLWMFIAEENMIAKHTVV